jgi:hypothetical protein
LGALRERRRRVYRVEWLERRCLLSTSGDVRAAATPPAIAHTPADVVVTSDQPADASDRQDSHATGLTIVSVSFTPRSASAPDKHGAEATTLVTSASAAHHDTLSSAVTVPESDEVVIHGSLETVARPDLYKVKVDLHTAIYEVELNPATDSEVAPKQLELLDGEGQVVGSWTVERPATDVVVDLRATAPSTNQVFYVGVLASTVGPGGLGAYSVRITRQTADESAGPLEPSLVPVAAPAGGGPAARPGSTAESSFASDGEDGEDAASLGLAQGAALPLPLRAAGPLGGILGDGNLTPLVDPRSTAMVDLALLDLVPDETPAAGQPRSEATEIAPLVRLRGADGLPLLTAARPSDLAPAASGKSQPKPVPRAAETPPAVAVRVRVPLHVSLALLGALSFTMLLPDLSSAFDRLRPRRRPLPRIAGIDFGREGRA